MFNLKNKILKYLNLDLATYVDATSKIENLERTVAIHHNIILDNPFIDTSKRMMRADATFKIE